VATLAEIAAAHTGLAPGDVEHLVRLVGSWSLLSDLAYSDLLLVVPARDGGVAVLGQVRPNNRATVVGGDLLGAVAPDLAWPGARATVTSGHAHEGMAPVGPGMPVTLLPVGHDGHPIAAIARLQGPLHGLPSASEATYADLFLRFSAMLADGSFPFREADVAGPGLPRVGDGLVVLDAHGVVTHATPNAANALHRLGLYEELEGRRLDDLGVHARGIDRALEFALPVVDEIDRGPDVAILIHCVPVLAGPTVTGAVIVLRDVTDLRRLHRLVLNKDQAIREVHHRVKNNLQTVSSLLRLQARRASDAETATALLEAERRIRSIAVVHEVLSRDATEEVAFAEIVRALVTLVEDSVVAAPAVEITVRGDLGRLDPDVATPVAVVLTELLTNAVQHAFGAEDGTGAIVLELARESGEIRATVRDNGTGLPHGFSLDSTASLGLSIVRDLVRHQLGGTITMGPPAGDGAGTVVVVRVPTERPV
jgi:two-component system, sensor histidine kinase PdtaS